MKRYILIAVAISFALACKKEKKHSPPATATLLFPLRDQVCTEGILTSGNKTSVLFSWNAAAHADSYNIFLKNLATNGVSSYESRLASITISINRNTPYSWNVVSKSDHISNTTKSETWKFYSSGPGIVSHPPFPADVVAPIYGEGLANTAGKVKLSWLGSDADKDIESYEVYFGTTVNPPVYKLKITESQVADIPVSAGTKYFWKVITRDAKGNTSESEVFQFRVL